MKPILTLLLLLSFHVFSYAMNHTDNDYWLKKAQEAYDTTEGLQKVVPQETDNHEMYHNTPDVTQEDSSPLIAEANINEDDPKTWFQECPAQGKEFTCNYFKRRTYWNKAVTSSQVFKDTMLRHTDEGSYDTYHNDRCAAAAWVCAGANPNITSRLETPISKCLLHDDFLVVKIFLEHGLDPNKEVLIFMPPLYWARTKQMAALLVSYGANIHAKEYDNEPLLHHILENNLSSEKNTLELLDYYLEQNVPLNSLDDNNQTALHIVAEDHCFYYKKSIAKRLLKAGIDLDIRNKNGETAQEMLQSREDIDCKILYNMIEQERKERAELTTRG